MEERCPMIAPVDHPRLWGNRLCKRGLEITGGNRKNDFREEGVERLGGRGYGDDSARL